MGCVASITYDRFPVQAPDDSVAAVGNRVSVCYHYDSDNRHEGTVVRNDYEAPWLTIIQLDNGRYILATECQYHPLG